MCTLKLIFTFIEKNNIGYILQFLDNIYDVFLLFAHVLLGPLKYASISKSIKYKFKIYII